MIAPDPAAADVLRGCRPRWSVNGLALALVPELLERTDLAGWARSIAELRSDFAGALRALGFEVIEAAANWVLVQGVADLRSHLAPHGVVVRDCTSFGLVDTVRVALPSPEHLDRVVAAFGRCR